MAQGLLFRAELEIRFVTGKGPLVFRNSKHVLTIDNIFDQNDDTCIHQAGDYLYFRETGTTLMRVSFTAIRDKIEKDEKTITADKLLDDVKSSCAVDDRYYGLNWKGELRSHNSTGLKLGPNLIIDAASAIVPIEDRIVVAWHSTSTKKNVIVLATRNLDYQYTLAYDAAGSTYILTQLTRWPQPKSSK